MKRLILSLMIGVLLLSGCQAEDGGMEKVLLFRKRLLSANGCSFFADVRADYGTLFYEFGMLCEADQSGNLTFQVTKPDTIADISGSFSDNGGKLRFDASVLAFPALADGEVSPVSAPWLLYQTLRGGYIDTVGEEGGMLRATIHDNYQQNALQVDIWFDGQTHPKRAEILWQGRNVLSITVEDFAFM